MRENSGPCYATPLPWWRSIADEVGSLDKLLTDFPALKGNRSLYSLKFGMICEAQPILSNIQWGPDTL